MGFITPVPFTPSPIATECAAKAAAGSGKRKIPSGVINNLAKKSKRMQSEFQQSMETHVKKKLDSMSGPSDNRKRGLKVAQFIPGKGLEVAGVQMMNDPSITCSLGVKSHKLEDALDKTFDLLKGKKVSMDFAYKLICKPSLSSKAKNSRVTALNCFRHLNPASFSYKLTGPHEGSVSNPLTSDNVLANESWHSTLGPDASFIRRGVDGLTAPGVSGGTWRGGDSNTGGLAQHYDGTSWDPNAGAAKLANSLYSPYRYPNDFEAMYSRINRQTLENYGFALNRFRFVGSAGELPTTDPFGGGVVQATSLRVYDVPSSQVMNFGSTTVTNPPYLNASFPAQINNSIKVPTGFVTPGQSELAELYEYHSQLGNGKLSYQFSNDGTNPVCIDMCVVAVKKGDTAAVHNMQKIFAFNYGVDKFRNNKLLNLNGYQSQTAPTLDSDIQKVDFDFGSDAWHTDAKLPFIPDECFKDPQAYLNAVQIDTASAEASDVFASLEQGQGNPFKLVKRDQFIVSAGATRAWNTSLPAIKYRPQVYETKAAYPAKVDPDVTNITADEYTYVFLVGASGMSRPMEELYPGQTVDQTGALRKPEVLKQTITDHEPSSCNISVVGTYTETVYPAYPKDCTDKTFINGRLSLPYFSEAAESDKIDHITNAIHEYPDRLATVDIATTAQTVRATSSGISGVGAISTVNGA